MSIASPSNRMIEHAPSAKVGTGFAPGRGADKAPQDREAFDLPAIAAREFRTRQSYASREIAAGRMTRAQAEAKLRPWLAIAERAGADLPDLLVPMTEIYPDAGKPVDGRLRADEIAPRTDWQAELKSARDAAIRASEANPSKLAHARELVALARALTPVILLTLTIGLVIQSVTAGLAAASMGEVLLR